MRLAFSVTALALVAAPALAQVDPAPPTGNTIVVTGSTDGPSSSEVYDQARELTRMDGRESRLYNEPLARFEAPLCPAVFGLKGKPADEIAERIRANAQRLKARLAKANCMPNLLVVFAEDGQSYLGELERKYPRLFELVDQSERTELLSGAEPVRVWSNVIPRSLVSSPAYRWKGKWHIPAHKGSVDKFFLPSRTDIDSAVVVFDKDAVIGMTALQLADYATMRGLAHTRPADGNESLETILGLFAEGSGGNPDQLTSFDLGYLESLYRFAPNIPAVSKLLDVRKLTRQADE